MDYQFRSLEKSVSDYFAKLKEKERLLRTRIEDQEKNEKELETTRNHLQQEIDLLKVRKAQMEERLSSENYSIPTALTMSYQHYKKQRSGTQNLFVFHKDLIKKILECFKKDLEIILQCSSTEVVNEIRDTRDTYQVYGLLLSACSLRKEKPNPGLVDKVLGFYTVSQQECLKDNVSKAVMLTQNMLILLPPLVVTTLPQLYNEQLHETNRSTWDEFAALDSSRKLTYYRPILVYGNQLHVAMKGLVGNVEQQHQEQQQEQQEQQPQQQQVMQQPQQQHLMPQQPQHQQLMLQQQQQHQLQQFQQQQQQHHWYQQQQGMPLATSYIERHGSQTRSGSNQTCIQGHPHIPYQQVEDKGYKVSRGPQGLKRCAVCNNPCYNERQCYTFGPDRVVVHQHCHKCNICGIDINLKLYYEELVCVKHINKLTCRICGNSGQLRFEETGYHCSCQDTIV